MMQRQCCSFHGDEDIVGVGVGGLVYEFTCERTSGHPEGGVRTWRSNVGHKALEGLAGVAQEMGLEVELPAAIDTRPGKWIEHGVVEAAYAQSNPDDFAWLVRQYSHRAIKTGLDGSASSILGSALGRLADAGLILRREAPGSGPWATQRNIGWYAKAPAPDWATARVSWADAGLDFRYVPDRGEGA